MRDRVIPELFTSKCDRVDFSVIGLGITFEVRGAKSWFQSGLPGRVCNLLLIIIVSDALDFFRSGP